MSLSYCVTHLEKRWRMLVWLASMRPLTRCAVCTYGDLRLNATWMLAGPQSMKLASLRSRMRCRLLCTCVGSTSPWMMFRMDMYLLWLKSLFLECVLTMMFFVCSRRRITSSTVVLRTVAPALLSTVSGVYPVMRKWHRGVGMRLATRPTRSLFMYPGYRRVVVLAAITVDTRELVCAKLGFSMLSLSTAMRFSAVLSSTTTLSQLSARRFRVSRLL
mmetsp:Transcript_9266/g.32186  ORF Transcript_9266/g.32186 Transcript_9266/m.32186 type:complete len:217 (+) Transcript_9266:251-901(+)